MVSERYFIEYDKKMESGENGELRGRAVNNPATTSMTINDFEPNFERKTYRCITITDVPETPMRSRAITIQLTHFLNTVGSLDFAIDFAIHILQYSLGHFLIQQFHSNWL